MTNDTTVRANRQGSLCPPWCTQDHDIELIPGRYADTHSSDYLLTADYGVPNASVIGDGRVFQSIAPEPDKVYVRAGIGAYSLEAGTEERFAEFLEGLAGRPAEEISRLAYAVRTAATIVRRTA